MESKLDSWQAMAEDRLFRDLCTKKVAKTTAEQLSNIIILITALALIFIICYFCDKLKSASEEIFIAACENPWHEGDLQYQRILLLIMMRSQKPCYFTSLKYTPITLKTYTKILSSTWSYFSLMNTMYNKNSE